MNLPGGQMQQSTADLGLASRDSRKFLTATTLAMTPLMRSVMCDTTSNAITVTLPGVAECAGMFFAIHVVTDGGNDVTITDNGDDADFVDVVIKAVNLACLLFSTGDHWIALAHTTGNYGS